MSDSLFETSHGNGEEEQSLTVIHPVHSQSELLIPFCHALSLVYKSKGELEVVDVTLGQKAVVEPDAIPGLELEGTVDKIADVFVEKRGDITYTVRIKLEEVDPRLRWGMTVAITFKE